MTSVVLEFKSRTFNSYLVLGFTQLVLQFREAESSYSDEVTDHSHKLIPTFPRPALLVVQLLVRSRTNTLNVQTMKRV